MYTSYGMEKQTNIQYKLLSIYRGFRGIQADIIHSNGKNLIII